MITIIHGDEIVRSRKKLTELIAANIKFDIIRFEGEKTSVTDIIQAFESQSLFDQTKLIILERFMVTKDKVLLASVVNHIRKYPQHLVVFWESKEIKKDMLTLFPPTADVQLFKQEQKLFLFLDAIVPGNKKYMLSLLSDLRRVESEELIFYMVVRQFRLLLGLLTGSSIDEVKRLAPWQRDKLERQALRIGDEQLKNSYKKLFAIEKSAKTGTGSMQASSQLDLFLLGL